MLQREDQCVADLSSLCAADGGANRNCPKHLARFDWAAGADSAVSVKVYPHDTAGGGAEAGPSATPFFAAFFTPLRWAPAFPSLPQWLHRVGLDTTLVMPPLPRGAAAELPGTGRWCLFVPWQHSRCTRLGWFEFDFACHRRPGDDGDDAAHPGRFLSPPGRWQLGTKMEDAVLFMPETWQPPVSKPNL